MKRYLKLLWIPMLCATVSIFACVTINIYFPAEKVESVAGDIVNEIRGEKGEDKEGSLKNDLGSFFQKTLIALSPSYVWADEATTISNPTIRALKEKMKSRFSQMKSYYGKGMLKEGSNGYVSLGSIEELKLKEKRDLKSLVDAENNDRKSLYREVAKALKIEASQVNRIAEIFAKEWQKSVQ